MPAMRQLKQTEFSAYGGWMTWGVVGFTVLFIIAAVGAALILHATGEGHLLQPWCRPFAGINLLIWAGLVVGGAFTCLLVAVSVKVIRCRRIYGDSTLIVTHYPDVASNTFCARVVTSAAAAGQRRFTIRLCEKHTSINGPELEVWSRTLLLDPRQVTVEGARAVIPMEFDLSGVPEPPEDTPSEKTIWRVVVRATGQRPEYLASFMLSPTGSPFVRYGDGHRGAGRRP